MDKFPHNIKDSIVQMQNCNIAKEVAAVYCGAAINESFKRLPLLFRDESKNIAASFMGIKVIEHELFPPDAWALVDNEGKILVMSRLKESIKKIST